MRTGTSETHEKLRIAVLQDKIRTEDLLNTTEDGDLRYTIRVSVMLTRLNINMFMRVPVTTAWRFCGLWLEDTVSRCGV